MPISWDAMTVPINAFGRRRALAAVLLATALLASACGGNDRPTAPPSDLTSGSSGNEEVHGKLPIGSLSVVSGSPSCQRGEMCQVAVSVECPDVEEPARANLVIQPAVGEPRGVVMVFLGTLGTGFEGLNRQSVSMTAADGFQVVIVSWVDSWLQSASGETVGPKLLGCRPATTIQWTHDNIYEQLGSPEGGDGRCGFCLTGNSGGASQIAYSMSFYGVADLVDAAVLTGGPPHTDLDDACLGSDPSLAFDAESASNIDLSYGFSPGTGPCVKHDDSFASKWKKDGADAGGDYSFPDTRIAFIFVKGDRTPGPPHGKLYLEKLEAAGSPTVRERTIAGSTHTISALPEGREAIEEELLSE